MTRECRTCGAKYPPDDVHICEHADRAVPPSREDYALHSELPARASHEAELRRLKDALQQCRKAAGSGQSMTNRMQYIYARAGVALAGEDWSEEWKAEYGYNLRDRTLLENERLTAELATAEARLDYLENHCRRENSTIRIGTEMKSCTAWAISSAPGRTLRETIDGARQATEGGSAAR